MRRAFAIAAPLLLAAPVLLTACQGQPAEPSADQAWVRLPAIPGRPGAAYLTLHGGKRDRTLVSVSTPMASRAELHESMEEDRGGAGRIMTMRPIDDLRIPAGGTVAFAPGGRHVMLFDIKSGVRPGDQIRLVLGFSDGDTLETRAKVVATAATAPY